MTAIPDPRTMPADDLRNAVRQTHKAVRNAWVSQAMAFRRIQDEELYLGWGFETWTAYANSDLPGLALNSVGEMKQALSYLEANEPSLIQALSGHWTDPVSAPGWGSIRRLDSLRRKSLSTSLVDAADWRSLHERAFGRDGACPSDRQLNRWCSELGKGIKQLSTNEQNKMTEQQRKLHSGNNALAIAAEAIKTAGAMAKRQEISVDTKSGHRGFVSRITHLIQTMDKAFGVAQVDRFIANARNTTPEQSKPRQNRIEP